MPYNVIILAQKLYRNVEDLTAFGSCFLITININWADKIATFFFSIGASLLSAFLVSVIKKSYISEWLNDKIKEKINNGKKDKHP